MKFADIDFHLEKLKLEPGDIIVMKFRHELSGEHIARLRSDLEPRLDGHKCLVVGPADNLSIMTAFEIERRTRSAISDETSAK
jgi:hypothetical protein